ncbi:MAG: T9SS type A sorting domain-containing protein [Flavobacteriales bacterium]
MNASLNPTKFLFIGSLMMYALTNSIISAQCDAGEVAIEFVIDTDAWGYEMYWELTPTGEACGGENFIASGGNSANVGCDGAGNGGNGGTTYGNNAIYMEGPFCLAEGQGLDLIHVDSYGDGGSRFDVYMDGLLSGIFNGTGYGNVWTFTAGESLFIDYDIPCAAAPIEVNGPSVMVNSVGGSIQSGEVSPPAAPSGSCSLSGSWCGSDGNVSSSVWLSFVAEATDPVTITTCSDSSTFDTQLALYHVTDCSDFSTFELVASNDDWCAGYRSTMYSSCLEAGEQYLIQVDGWAGQTGIADVSVFTTEVFETSVDAQVRNVTCPLDKDVVPNGFILPYVNAGGSDFECAWTGPNGFQSNESWIFDLSPGTYTAEVTTACGTSFSLERVISAPASWDVTTDITQASCETAADGSVEVDVQGASSPYEFAWTGPGEFASNSEDISMLVPGTYQLNITDNNGCTYPVTAYVPEVEASDFYIGNDTIICEDEPLLIYGPLGYDYEWQDGSNNQFFYVAPGDFEPGTYSIVLNGTTETGCSFADALILTVHDCSVGTTEMGLGEAKLFPNPANGLVYLDVNPGIKGWVVEAFDRTGKLVERRNWNGVNEPVFDVSNWSDGHYILQFQDDQRVLTWPLIIQNGVR